VKVKTLDGEVIEGSNINNLVNHMHTISRSPCKNVHEFMTEFSERAKYFFPNSSIRTDTATNFIEDCLNCGILKPVDEVTK
jgi:hypothetical protein